MVKLVDTRDLKSLDCNGHTGSIPVPGTNHFQLVSTRNRASTSKNSYKYHQFSTGLPPRTDEGGNGAGSPTT